MGKTHVVFELDANRTTKARQSSGSHHVLGAAQHASIPGCNTALTTQSFSPG